MLAVGVSSLFLKQARHVEPPRFYGMSSQGIQAFKLGI
jgi:hypothetical protein